jgi:hypothetical protein
MKNRDDRAKARPSISRDATDKTAGDEGLDENMSGSGLNSERLDRASEEGRSSSVRTDDVRDVGSIDRAATRRAQSQSGSRAFQGQGGQKGGTRGSEQGTGYSSDRSTQLQEDDSLSGSQGRHGTSGSREGSSSRQSSSNRDDRVAGEPEQDPRDIDRSNM